MLEASLGGVLMHHFALADAASVNSLLEHTLPAGQAGRSDQRRIMDAE